MPATLDSGLAPLSPARQRLQAPRPPSSAPQLLTDFGWLRRNALYVALVVALTSCMICLAIALDRPWVGWDLRPLGGVAPASAGATAPTGVKVHAVASGSPAARAGIRPGSTLLALGSPGGQPVPLSARDLIEDPDLLNSYRDWGDFYERQQKLAHVRASPAMEATVARTASRTETVTVAPQATRPISSLPPAFWGQLLIGLLVMMAAGWVVSVYPGSVKTLYTAASSFGVMVAAHAAAVFSTRELAFPKALFHGLSVTNHAGSALGLATLGLLISTYPKRLNGWSWPRVAVLALVVGTWLVADALWWLPSPDWGARAMFPLLIVMVLINLARQWWAARGDARAMRAVRGAVVTLMFGTNMLVFLLEVLPLLRIAPPASQALIYGLVLLPNLGIALSTRMLRPYDLDEWILQAFAGLAGAAGIWLLAQALVTLLGLEWPVALLIALTTCWVLYVPLFRWLQRKYMRRAERSLEDLTGDILLLGLARPNERLTNWRLLLAQLFRCRRIDTDPEPAPKGVDEPQVKIVQRGEALLVPTTAGMPALTLRERDQGRRLFNDHDRRLAQRLCGLVDQIVATREAYGRGAEDERKRIADDLHDDLGAKLLALVHASDGRGGTPEISTLGRQALEEMRLAVRNLKARPVPVADVLADWRGEAVSRLQSAGLEVSCEIDAAQHGDDLMAARTHAQLTRVLREAVSNVIRHSSAENCAISVTLTDEHIELVVQDDGAGIGDAEAAGTRGHGLASIERRVRKLDGTRRILTGPAGGTLLVVRVPLSAVITEPQPLGFLETYR